VDRAEGKRAVRETQLVEKLGSKAVVPQQEPQGRHTA